MGMCHKGFGPQTGALPFGFRVSPFPQMAIDCIKEELTEKLKSLEAGEGQNVSTLSTFGVWWVWMGPTLKWLLAFSGTRLGWGGVGL